MNEVVTQDGRTHTIATFGRNFMAFHMHPNGMREWMLCALHASSGARHSALCVCAALRDVYRSRGVRAQNLWVLYARNNKEGNNETGNNKRR